MPRISEVAPLPIEILEPYLRQGAVEEIAALTESLNKFDSEPYGIIPELLTDEALRILEQLEVPVNDKCPQEELLTHPIAGPLAQTMGRISLANMDLRSEPRSIEYRLRNETGENVRIEPHRDLLDGHAVLFNYRVLGELFYVLDDKEHRMKSNEMVILNGAAVWGDITNFLPGQEDNNPFDGWRTLGGVTVGHTVQGKGFTSRNRLLVYADGRETLFTQVPVQLPPWF